MKIGNISIESKVFLAPMSAVNCPSFRLMCKEYGAGLVYTQVFWSWEIDTWKDRLDVEFSPGKKETPLAVQVGGNKPDEIKKSLELLEPHADIIDFNAGCGEAVICGKQSGSFLLLHPEQLKRAVSAVMDSTNKPVTVKMRTGWDDNRINCVEVSKMLEDLGVAAIAVHGRTRKQAYMGHSDPKHIMDVKSAVNIPVIGNGDIQSPQDAQRMFDSTGCDAVMVGRAAKGNPYLFKQINSYFENGTFKEQSKADGMADLKRFLQSYHKFEKDRSFSEAQHHALWFLSGWNGVFKLKDHIINSKDIEEIERMIF